LWQLILNALPCDAGEDLCVREPLNNFPAAMFSPKDCEPAAFLRLFLNALAGSVYTGSFLVGIFLAGARFAFCFVLFFDCCYEKKNSTLKNNL
jgi:hypothetical protein